MSRFKNIFTAYMDNKGIQYVDKNEIMVSIHYAGKNLETITVTVGFKNDGGPTARLVCYNIGNISEDMRVNAIVICNKLNADCGLAKFYLDEDNDICAQIDTYFDENTCGAICTFLAKNLYMLVDECYPYFRPFQE